MWIARDKNGALTLFENKPEIYDGMWCQSDEYLCSTMDLDINLFPNLKWEDEPIEVGLYELNPTYTHYCSKCAEKFTYHKSDIDTSVEEGISGYIACPHCGEYNTLYTD